MLWTVVVLLLGSGHACTNFIVTSGATCDQSTIFANTADAGGLHGALPHFPAGKHAPGTRRKLYDTDTGRFLGEIDEAAETYNVIGNLNEYGVAIGETRFGGNATLAGGEGIMDYGNLIWVTLQRTKTAFQAVHMFGSLVEKYGYISAGVSFTIADAGEAWVLEMVGKGRLEKGAVWVAVRIPDGHISGHASQARIQRFSMDSPLECVYSKDIVTFAAKIGLWDASRPCEQFSFAEIYDPISFTAASRNDARLWAFFAVVGGGATLGEVSSKLGSNSGKLNSRGRLPLSVMARAKISVLDLMKHMRNHYDGTSLYQEPAVGMLRADAMQAHPKNWQYGNSSIVHSHLDGAQEGGWNFVAHLRAHYPAPIGGLLWFGIDDATFTVHVPIHGGTTRVPKAFRDGDETFWAFNAAAQFINPRWSLAPSILKRAHAIEETFQQALLTEEWKAWQLYQSDPAQALELLTQQEENRAKKATKAEFALLGNLMAHFQHRSYFRGAERAPRAGLNAAGLQEAAESPDFAGDDLAELKNWFAKMAQQKPARMGGLAADVDHLDFEALWAAPPSDQRVGNAARSIQRVRQVAIVFVSSAMVTAIIAIALGRFWPSSAQDSRDAAQEPLTMELWAIQEEDVE